MNEWYRFKAQDTLFFRGAEPAVMGESHSASFNFPPPPHTLAGALRTAVLVQNGVKYSDYKNGECKSEIIGAIGKAGTDSPFGIIGPLFETPDGLWLPCPYTWFAAKEDIKNLLPIAGTVNILEAKPVTPGAIELKTSSGKGLMWVKGEEPESLGGFWVSVKSIASKEPARNIRKAEAFFVQEPHTGIAMDYGWPRRTARKHHLYSFVHARLMEDAKIVFGVTARLPLQDKGILQIGAEQRFGQYERTDAVQLPRGSSGLFMSLSLVEGSEESNCACVATGKFKYLGGWDMNKEFHKPMKGFFPAGTVFNQNIKAQCLQL